MALPPVIPTSFVPRPSASGSGRKSPLGLGSVFTALALFFFVVALVAAAGVFIYNSILASEQSSDDAALAKAESALDPGTIEQFIRLHDRLSSAGTLLNSHVALSGLFNLLETVTPADASFSSVSVKVDPQGNAELTANGTAKSFNALAAASNDFSTDSRLKNAIFSNLAIAANGTVSFVLSATLAPSLIAYTGTEARPAASAPPAASTTAASSTPTKP